MMGMLTSLIMMNYDVYVHQYIKLHTLNICNFYFSIDLNKGEITKRKIKMGRTGDCNKGQRERKINKYENMEERKKKEDKNYLHRKLRRTPAKNYSEQLGGRDYS